MKTKTKSKKNFPKVGDKKSPNPFDFFAEKVSFNELDDTDKKRAINNDYDPEDCGSFIRISKHLKTVYLFDDTNEVGDMEFNKGLSWITPLLNEVYTWGFSAGENTK